MARKIKVEIVGDSSSLERAFNRSSAAGRKFSVGIGTLAKGAAVFGLVAGAATVMGRAASTAFDEWKDMVTVAAQTNAVLKSTGSVANVTAAHVDKLATSISAYSGEDDEAVHAAENLLLTFKAVKNEVGAGNNVFDRATKAAVDLARAGFGSLSTNAKQLGKVLNDPVKGMTALNRSGVTFTAGQRKLIKHLAETGHLLQAQKLVLREVESQVGGSAKAYGRTLPGQLSRLKESFRNTLGGLAQQVARPLAGALGHVNAFMDRIQKAKGVKAKFNVAIEGVEDLGQRVFRLVRNSLASVDWPGAVKGAQEGLVSGLRKIAGVLASINWGEVGRTLGRAIATGLQGAKEFLQSVDWQDVGQTVVRGIANFLKHVNWKDVAVSTVKLLVSAFIATRLLLLGLGKELGGQLMAGIGKGVDAGVAAVLRKLLAFVKKVLGVTGFLGRFDPFKGVRAKVQRQLDAMEGDTRRAVTSINSTLAGIQDVDVTISIDTVSTFNGRSRPEEGTSALSAAQGVARDRISDAKAKAAAKTAAAAAKARQKAADAVAATTAKAAAASKAAAKRAAVLAKKAGEERDKAFASAMDSLSLKFDRAESAHAFRQALAVLAQEESAVRKQIAAAGHATELERELFRIEQDRKSIREQMASLAKDKATKALAKSQSRQFKALGLSGTGDEIVPGVANLRKQFAALSDRVSESPGEVGQKLVSRLAGVRKLLGGAFGKLTEDTRKAIADLFGSIRDEFDNQDKKGPLTKTTSLNSKALLSGLGLSADQIGELRGRLSGFNSAGVALAKPAATGSFVGGPVTVESHTTLNIDGHQVTKVVTRGQQKRTRRNPAQRRGPNRGGI